jgi:hypothetical protein
MGRKLEKITQNLEVFAMLLKTITLHILFLIFNRLTMTLKESKWTEIDLIFLPKLPEVHPGFQVM